MAFDPATGGWHPEPAAASSGNWMMDHRARIALGVKATVGGFGDLEKRHILEMHVAVCDEPGEEGAFDEGMVSPTR